MGKKNWDRMSGAEAMAAKIDEIHDRLRLIENLLSDLSPGLGKISKEIGPTISELREIYERDETLTLVKKAGDSIPTFVELLKLMEVAKGTIEDLTPALGKITKEISPVVKDIREVYERDETLDLVMKVGENIPTFLELLKLMEVTRGLAGDLMPAMGKISKEVMPSINALRESFEREEVLNLLQKAGDNIDVFNKLLGFLSNLDKSGTLDFTLKNVGGKEMGILLRGMQTTAVKTMEQYMEKPPRAGMGKLIGAMMDPEVQKGLLFLTAFAKNLSRCMAEACIAEPIK